MVVSNNHEILSELEQQLAYLTDSSQFLFTLSFLTLDTIVGSPDPVQMLLNYDMIIATTIDYPQILKIAPMFKNKILCAELSPRSRTLMQFSTLPSNTRFCLIYRTEVFKNLVINCLVSLDFKIENILCVIDLDYNPNSHSDNDINVVLNFNDSPIFVDPNFKERNDEFIKNGGSILRFEYQIQRGSLLHIEDQLQRLIKYDNEVEKN